MTGTTTVKWYRGAAKFGLISKGIVYCLSGAIAFLAAAGPGNQSPGDAGKTGVFSFIEHQPLGKWLLAAIGLGLVCYTGWRWLQAFRDTEHKGRDRKGLVKRFTYFTSGFVYAGLALYCIKKVFEMGGNSGNARQDWVSKLLHQPFGKWMVIAAALVMIGTGLYQLYRAISGKYKKYVRGALHKKAGKWVITLGIAGYTARGIVWLVLGWLFIKAAILYNPRIVGGSDAAFRWLSEASYKGILLAAVALGLVCYGVFMFLRAKYQPIRAE